MRLIGIFLISLIAYSAAPTVQAAEPVAPSCKMDDKICLFDLLEKTTSTVPEEQWRDSTYRELAKLLAHEKQVDRAIPLIDLIKTPDTQALTIRGIGMAAAKAGFSKEELDSIFFRLHEKAAKIEHPPSHAIALTYIAMSQAFAGDDDGAMKTALAMENSALRHKALGESAEIQAERDDPDAAFISMAAIEDAAFREKALRTVSKIFADRGHYDSALKCAELIENPYQKAQSVLYILVKQISPEEVSLE
jgi:hypothetical protein